MIIEVPLNYQPIVGQNIEVSLSGKVLGIQINPLAPDTVMATLAIEDDKGLKYVGPGQYQKLDPTMAVNGMPGSTF